MTATDVEHEHCGARSRVFGFIDFEVFFFQREIVDAVAAESVGQCRGEVDVIRRSPTVHFFVSLRRSTPFPVYGVSCVPTPPFLRDVKISFERVLPNTLNAFRRQNVDVVHFLDDAHFFQLLDEIIDGHRFIEDAVFLCKLTKPLDRLLDVTAGLQQQITEESSQLFEPLLVGHRSRNPFGIEEFHQSSSSLCPRPAKILPTRSLYSIT